MPLAHNQPRGSKKMWRENVQSSQSKSSHNNNKKKLWVFVGKLPEVTEQAGNGHVPHVSNIRMSQSFALLSELFNI